MTKPYFMWLGALFSVPPMAMMIIIVIKSIMSGQWIGGFFILFPLGWACISVPFIGSFKKWHIDKPTNTLEISHLIFGWPLRRKEIQLNNYRGVAWGINLSLNGAVKFYSCFTLVHEWDSYRDVYTLGSELTRDEHCAQEKAKEYAAFLEMSYLGRYDCKSLTHTIYGG